MSNPHARLLSLIVAFTAGLLAPGDAAAWVTSSLVISGSTWGGTTRGVETKCKDRVDNDGDGLTDAFDSDCSSSGSSGTGGTIIDAVAGSSDPDGDGIMPVPFWLVTLSTGARELYALSTVDAAGNAVYVPFMTGVERLTRGALIADWADVNGDGKLDAVLGAADSGKYGMIAVYLGGTATTYSATRPSGYFRGDTWGVNITRGLALDGDTLLVDVGRLSDAGPGYLLYAYASAGALRANDLSGYWAVVDEATGAVTYR
jgi:hypothetical protein